MPLIVGHNGQLHAIDVIGLALTVLVAIVAFAWLAAGYLRKRSGQGRPPDHIVVTFH